MNAKNVCMKCYIVCFHTHAAWPKANRTIRKNTYAAACRERMKFGKHIFVRLILLYLDYWTFQFALTYEMTKFSLSQTIGKYALKSSAALLFNFCAQKNNEEFSDRISFLFIFLSFRIEFVRWHPNGFFSSHCLFIKQD